MGKSSPNRRKRKPYLQRSDLERVQSQWVKLTGLHNRTDWSAAVVRAATATEIAVNFAIRREFSARSQLDAKFVDGLLGWANGLSGKLDRLLLPLVSGSDKHAVVRKLCPLARKIHKKRNEITHSGHFSTESEATALIADCRAFVYGIVHVYEPAFSLKEEAASV